MADAQPYQRVFDAVRVAVARTGIPKGEGVAVATAAAMKIRQAELDVLAPLLREAIPLLQALAELDADGGALGQRTESILARIRAAGVE